MLEFDRLCAEILPRTRLLTSMVAGADPMTPVPSCPGWNLGQLLHHVGGVHRWTETIVGTRARMPVSDDIVNDLSGYRKDMDEVGRWLDDGALRLTETLREAGPDIEVWTPGPGDTATFWARHALHETVMHGSDAAEALDTEFDMSRDVAVDGFETWLGCASVPEAYETRPGQPELLGPGRSLAFQTTDGSGHWLVDLTGPAATWRHGTGPAAVAVRGSIADLLLFVYRRPPRGAVDITGDRALLELWRDRAGFWLNA